MLAPAGVPEQPRDLDLPEHGLTGIHFAMDFLTQQNKRGAGDLGRSGGAIEERSSAAGAKVVVIGGGDTGSDCIGTSTRQGSAASITQLEILAAPPERENKALTWPNWPLKMRTSSSQEEGCERAFAIATRQAVGSQGRITALECVRLEWSAGKMQEIVGSAFMLEADLVLLAMGFVGPRRDELLEQSGVSLDGRGNIAAGVDDYQTSRPKVFACGDMRRGQSLVVWAIREGRQCARGVDDYLTGRSELPR